MSDVFEEKNNDLFWIVSTKWGKNLTKMIRSNLFFAKHAVLLRLRIAYHDKIIQYHERKSADSIRWICLSEDVEKNQVFRWMTENLFFNQGHNGYTELFAFICICAYRWFWKYITNRSCLLVKMIHYIKIVHSKWYQEKASRWKIDGKRAYLFYSRFSL